MDILFGALKYDTVINLLILKAKFFIYKKRMDASIPLFNQFVLSIRYHYQIERYNAVKNRNLEKFDKSWSPYKALLN